jgi:hypothetical protein
VERFIVGTGRCGSTLLSRMLAENRSLLMIFELFSGLDGERRFESGALDGARFASLLEAETPALTMAMKRGYDIAEVVYPFGPRARYRREGGLPWIVAAALARMSDDPDSLFDATIAFARTLPTQTLAAHYRALLDWLAARMERRAWIEKSGSSIEYLPDLHAMYPQARFLHLHRDGREAALSMREHHVYRLWVSMMYGPPAEAHVGEAELAAVDPSAPAKRDDAVTRMLESKPEVEKFGRYWSDLVARGMSCIARLEPEQYMEASFEELVARPESVLADVARFFELEDDPGWIARAAALVRGAPPRRYGTLSAADLEHLDRSCEAARRLLGQIP